MDRRENPDQRDDNLQNIAGNRSVRRGRRYTPPGLRVPRAWLRRHEKSDSAAPVKIGEVAAELTPRQAVVWLLNLDTMISLYESTTERELDKPAREQLVHALRSIVRDHGQRKK